MIDLQREICKLVFKLDFTADGIMESLTEFGSSAITSAQFFMGDLCCVRINVERKLTVNFQKICKFYFNFFPRG